MTYPTKKLGEVLDKSKFSVGKIKTKEYLENGDFPIVDQGKSLIGGYSNNKELVYDGKLPVLVYGDHTNIVKFIDFKFIGGADGIKVLPFSDNYDVRYGYYLLENFKPKTQGYRRHFSFFKEIDLPLPPISTQKLIVQKLDIAFKNIDESINITKKNIDNIEKLNNSVLEKIFKESKYIEKSIDEISENVQYGYTGKTIENGKVKYLRITDIQNNNIIWDNVPFVEIEDKEIPKYSLNEGDIVFARTGATVGKSCLIDKNGVGNIFASYLIRIIGKKDILNPNYMQYFFYSIYYWEQIGFDVVGAAQPNFNGTKLKKIKIPLPPLEKQKEIVSYLDEVFEKNKVIKEGYENKLKDLEEMKQSILKEAFEGRLIKE